MMKSKKDYPREINGEYMYVQWPVQLTGPVTAELAAKKIVFPKAEPGNWVIANVLKEGELSFVLDSPVFKTYEACSQACADVNQSRGWNALESADIVRKSVITQMSKKRAKES